MYWIHRIVCGIFCIIAGISLANGQFDLAKIEGALRKVLPADFDLDTVGMQIWLTNWTDYTPESESSTYTLLDVLLEQMKFQHLSKDCKAGIARYISDAVGGERYTAALVDAMAKIPSGITLGHILTFGQFDQCVGAMRWNATVKRPDFPLNYCLVRVSHPKIRERLPVLPAYGMCVPRGCDNPTDASHLFEYLFDRSDLTKDVDAAQTQCLEPMVKDPGFYIVFALMFLILAIIIVSCIVHWRYYRKDSQQNHDGKSETNVQIYEMKTPSATITNNGTVRHIPMVKKNSYGYVSVPASLKPILCWHPEINLQMIFTVPQDGEIPFLHGFRALTMFWIILGNVYAFGKLFSENMVSFNFMSFGFLHQVILNFDFAFDGLFLVTGLLVTYTLLRDLERKDGNYNWFFLYFHRWWRLTPVYVFVMMLFVYILPHGLMSPFKLFIAQQGPPPYDYCKSHWWTNVLYFNNFYPFVKKEQCMYWTWFLALDMQLFVVAPLLIIILYKSHKAGIASIAAVIIACIATTMGIIGRYGLPINWMEQPVYNATETGFDKEIDYIDQKPYTRIAPFAVGILLGYMMVKCPTKRFAGTFRTVLAIFGWLSATGLAIPLIWGFTLSGWNRNPLAPSDQMTLTGRIIYGGVRHFLWSLVLAWVIFACHYGLGGVVKRFLSLRIWRGLSNLTYGAYLCHMLAIQLYFASQRRQVFFTNLNFVIVFLGQIGFTYFFALVISLLVEVPLLRLERLIIQRKL